MALRLALAFMFERDRPWSIILFSSEHDTTIFREFEEVMTNSNPTRLSHFKGFEILYQPSSTKKMIENHCLEIASYDSLHTYLTAHANVQLQQSVLAALPKPWFQGYFRERHQEIKSTLIGNELPSCRKNLISNADNRVNS